ncbi:MAG: Uncharacterized protein XD43_0489 [Thermococcales archaeon 44_46]|nr:MAG: Uncharacterized protein XD43_0489 [Thermococcales archaeon 44_46]HIH72174.1 PEGA domain-containing protein [Thermococcaceae archaeon]
MRRFVLSLVFVLFFFTGNTTAHLAFWWGHTFSRNVSVIAGDEDFIAVGLNAACYYESEPTGGTYEICDGNASVYLFKNGKVLWKKEMLGDFITSISYHNDMIALAVQKNSTGYVYLIGSNGKIIWKKEHPWVNSVFVSEKYIIVGDSKGYTYLFNKEGELLWRLKLGDKLYVNGEYILVGNSNNNTVYFLKLTDSGMRVLWRQEVGHVYKISTTGNYSLVVSFDNYQDLYFKKNPNVLFFSRNGTILWKRKFESLVDVEMSNDGKYVLIATPSQLYLLDTHGEAILFREIKDIVDVSVVDNVTVLIRKKGRIHVLNEIDTVIEIGTELSHVVHVGKSIIVAGKTSIYIFRILPPAETSIITVLAPSARIYLNNTFLTNSPKNITVVPGRYEVRVIRDRCINHTENISLRARDVRIIKIRGAGYLTVFSNVSNAEIYLNGTKIGAVPLLDYKLPEGKYFIRVMARGYKSYTQEVVINSCEHRVVNATLSPLFSETSETKIMPPLNASDKNINVLLVGVLIIMLIIGTVALWLHRD